jgi:hypothetical protein
MPYLALVEADLANMTRSWLVRIWLVLAAGLSLIIVLTALTEGTPAQSVADLLGTWPLIWSTFAIVVSAGAISSEAGVVADSILSKAVTRYGYVLSKLTARLITVLGIYLALVLPAVYVISRYAEETLAGGGVAWAVLMVGMPLVLLTCLGVAFSALFNRTLVAVVVVWVLWYAAGFIFVLLGVEYLSSLAIIDSLPRMLQGDYRVADQIRVIFGFGLPSVAVVLAAVWYFGRKDL